jgi:dihydrofolate reductase
MNRKIIVYIATSADGFIARRDGGVDWLDRPEIPGNYGMGTFLHSIDTILWGRKTYELSYKLGGGPETFGSKLMNYVFTRTHQSSTSPRVEFVTEPVSDFTARLRASPGKNIWMMGGAELIGSFLDAGEIDEFIIHVIPVMIGEGIPLISQRHRTIPLRLRSARSYHDGVVRLRYKIERAENPKTD